MKDLMMDTMTLELKFPQAIYLALQSAGLNRNELGERAMRELAMQLYADGRLSFHKIGHSLCGWKKPWQWFTQS